MIVSRLIVNAEPNASSSPSLRAGGAYWQYAYDDLGDLVGTNDPRACGENIAYDGAGRVLSEDYSPCDSVNQAPYTTPSTSPGDGDGTEAFYVYEGGALQTGLLSDVYDRASHSHFDHDPRGRLIEVTRQIANPGTPTSALSSRYSPTLWVATRGYDDRDRVTTQSTGADVAQLQSSNTAYTGKFGPSTVGVTYSTRGNLQTASGSYGPLVTGLVIEADGRPDSMAYADVAKTTVTYSYNEPRRRLTQVEISRAGSFPSATATYTPPAANAVQPTQQTILANDVTSQYDGVNNPIATQDDRNGGEWPAGAKPVTTRTYAYDDSYRLTGVTNTYTGGTDSYAPPIASSMPDTSPVPMSVTPQNRVLRQNFSYDGLGNLIGSTDDASVFLERSLGTTVQNNNLSMASGGPNQLLSASLTTTTGVAGSLSTAYDAAGNVTEISVMRGGTCTGGLPCSQRYTYLWDEVGHLAGADRYDYYPTVCTTRICPQLAGTYRLATQIAYAYDSGGQRVLRSGTDAGGSGTTYSAEIFPSLRLNHATWDTSTSTYEETAETEGVYLTLGGVVYGRVVYDTAAPSINGPLHVFLEITDQLDSTAIVVDRDTSELVERTTYLAYGALDSDYRPDRWQDFREDYKFTGKEDDVEIGLTYFGARYYSPLMGRWLSPDPLTIHGLAGDLNPYAYVGGHVTVATDPDGLDLVPVSGGFDANGDGVADFTEAGDPVPGLDPNSLPMGPTIIIGATPPDMASGAGGAGGAGDNLGALSGGAGANGGGGSSLGSISQALTSIGMGSAAFLYGAAQGLAPGGMLTSLLPMPGDAQSPLFQYWMGAGQMSGGLISAVGGAAGFTGGLVLAGPSGGVSAFATAVSAGAVANGVTAMGAGWATMHMAATKEVNVSRGQYPESAQHIEDARSAGQPKELTVDREGAAARRKAALAGTEPVPGMDRDEYPPAMFGEGGEGASVRPVTPGDNRGAGSCIGAQCRGVPNGTRVIIKVTP